MIVLRVFFFQNVDWLEPPRQPSGAAGSQGFMLIAPLLRLRVSRIQVCSDGTLSLVARAAIDSKASSL